MIINLKEDNTKIWDFGKFAIYCVEQITILNVDSTKNGYSYSFYFEFDNIEITYNKLSNNTESFNSYELKSIDLTMDEYANSNKTDEDIFKSLINTIQSDS